MAVNANENARVIDLAVERDKRKPSSEVPVSADRLVTTFNYRGRGYGAEVAGIADIKILLQGVRQEVERKEDTKAGELSERAKHAESIEEQIEIGKEAEDATETTQIIMAADYQMLENFFAGLTGENDVLPGQHGQQLFRLNESATAELMRLNQPTFSKSELVGMNDNRPNVIVKECFVLSQKKGEELKNLLKNVKSDRFKIVEGTENKDGFIVYMNGNEVPFLCPPEQDYSVERNKEQPSKNEKESENEKMGKVIPFDRNKKKEQAGAQADAEESQERLQKTG